MNKQYLEIYKKLLFSKELKTYAIVDGLRDEEIADKIFLTDLNHTILWDDEIIDDATETPLYLVELEEEDELVEELLNKHEKSIATYFQSPYGLEALQRYYSTFTYPKIELEEDDLKKGIFGFYDPNILPNYLTTLYNQEKIDEFFAGIVLWLTPRVDDESLAHFAFRSKKGNFESVSLVLDEFLEEENVSLNFDNISFPSVEHLDRYVQERVIDYEQIEVFYRLEQKRTMFLFYKSFEDNDYSFIDEKSFDYLTVHIDEILNELEALMMSSEAELNRYLCIRLYFLDKWKDNPILNQLKEAKNQDEIFDILDDEIDNILNKEMDNGRCSNM